MKNKYLINEKPLYGCLELPSLNYAISLYSEKV